jgi:hypothetical protein
MGKRGKNLRQDLRDGLDEVWLGSYPVYPVHPVKKFFLSASSCLPAIASATAGALCGERLSSALSSCLPAGEAGDCHSLAVPAFRTGGMGVTWGNGRIGKRGKNLRQDLRDRLDEVWLGSYPVYPVHPVKKFFLSASSCLPAIASATAGALCGEMSYSPRKARNSRRGKRGTATRWLSPPSVQGGWV